MTTSVTQVRVSGSPVLTSRRAVWIGCGVRILFAFLGFSGLVTEIATLVARGRFNAGDFFSYFTVEANTLTIVSLLVSGYAVVAGRTSRGLDFFRGAVTLYMTTTILIFIVLLSGYPSSELTAVPWDNTVLHYIMPIVVMLDWLIDSPRGGVAFRSALLWLAIPLLYLAYSLIRGPIANWYPYPFIDVLELGYRRVLLNTAGLNLAFLALELLLVAIDRLIRQNPSKTSIWPPRFDPGCCVRSCPMP